LCDTHNSVVSRRLDLPEVVSFTATVNERSIAVMRRLGMTRDPDETSTTRTSPTVPCAATSCTARPTSAQRSSAALTQEANEILEVAAVAGLGIEPQVIAEVTGLDPVAVQAELHEIVRAPGLLVGGTPSQEYVWYHALVRDAILSSISVGAQTRWREGLTGVLSGRGRGLEAARHALDALHGQARAAMSSVLFGVDEAIALLAFETGEDLCRRALALARPGVDAEIAVPLLGRLGLCLALTGQRQAAEEAWQQAAERARQTGCSDLLARVALAPEPLGRASTDTPLRWALLQEAVALPDLEPRLQIELTCAWLEEAAMPQHAITDEALAARVVRQARRHGSPISSCAR
jgi:hypothetical protein